MEKESTQIKKIQILDEISQSLQQGRLSMSVKFALGVQYKLIKAYLKHVHITFCILLGLAPVALSNL